MNVWYTKLYSSTDRISFQGFYSHFSLWTTGKWYICASSGRNFEILFIFFSKKKIIFKIIFFFHNRHTARLLASQEHFHDKIIFKCTCNFFSFFNIEPVNEPKNDHLHISATSSTHGQAVDWIGNIKCQVVWIRNTRINWTTGIGMKRWWISTSG